MCEPGLACETLGSTVSPTKINKSKQQQRFGFCGGLTWCGRHLKLPINSLVREQMFITLHCGDLAGNTRVKVMSGGLMVFTGESPVFKDWN